MIAWLTLLMYLQAGLPHKPADEYALHFAFAFRDRPIAEAVHARAGQRDLAPVTTSAGPLPYLTLQLDILQLPAGETRLRVATAEEEQWMTRKITPGSKLKIDLGFTDDIKDHVAPFSYTIYFLTSDKTPVNKIDLYFDASGEYYVNGQRRGKL